MFRQVRSNIFTLFAFFLLIAPGLHAQSTETGIIPGRILFMITTDANANDIVGDLRFIDGVASGCTLLKEVSAPMRIWELEFDHVNVPQQKMLDAVNRHPQVMMAQNDHPVAFRAIPNDPGYANQWQHQNIDSEAAWNITTGGTTADGDEIVVCVIEAANLLHSDLVGNRWVNNAEVANNGVDDDANGYVDDYDGWNPAAGNDNNLFGGAHGTNVAGMIGAKGNNAAGVAGANWNVKIMVVTVGSLSQSNVISSYTYPLIQRRRYNDTNGAQGAFVVATNASWGIDNGDPNSYPLWCAIYDTLGTEGILNCGATANNNVNVDVVGDMPTACSSPFMVSVTATNSSDMRTFSGYGVTTIDVGAPGENIYTTSGTTSGSTSNTYTSGTSFASPLTAGVIGLLYSAPCASMMDLVKSDPQAGAEYVRQKLFQGVEQVGNLPGQTVTGGRINANNSLQLIVSECNSLGCVPPTGSSVNETSPTSVQLAWTGSAGTQYNVRYRLIGAAQWTNVNNLNTASYSLSGLSACGSYEFQVQRVCTSSL
ncbi:MAG: S8 family serine peptidase, partial [Bacteroidota bacterium]|nr:S8 family serine peptidase [Bacteroidota bacterium]